MKTPWFSILSLLAYMISFFLFTDFDWRVGVAIGLCVFGKFFERVSEFRGEGSSDISDKVS